MNVRGWTRQQLIAHLGARDTFNIDHDDAIQSLWLYGFSETQWWLCYSLVGTPDDGRKIHILTESLPEDRPALLQLLLAQGIDISGLCERTVPYQKGM